MLIAGKTCTIVERNEKIACQSQFQIILSEKSSSIKGLFLCMQGSELIASLTLFITF